VPPQLCPALLYSKVGHCSLAIDSCTRRDRDHDGVLALALVGLLQSKPFSRGDDREYLVHTQGIYGVEEDLHIRLRDIVSLDPAMNNAQIFNFYGKAEKVLVV